MPLLSCTDITLDLGGQMRFGPDVEWLDITDAAQIDYAVRPERVQGMLEDVHRSALALGRTISRMMDWAELSAAQVHRETRSMAYRLDVAQAMAEVLGSTAFAKEVQAVLKVPPETVSGVFAGHPVQVRVEPCHLQCWSPDFHKIMTELLVNALRFSKPGRPVGVTGKALLHGRYQLEIANLGVAMPEKFISQIGALSQADREVHEQQGMGLGRALYNALLDHLGQTTCHVVLGKIALPNPASVALHHALGFKQVGHLHEVGFNDEQVVEIMAHVALNLYTNYINVALDIPVDFPKVALK